MTMVEYRTPGDSRHDEDRHQARCAGLTSGTGPARSTAHAEGGQSAVELAIILPVLIIMMVLVAESGYLLRNFLVISGANREAARFAARGRYTDQRAGERAVAAGGIVTLGGTDVPFLRTHGTEPNTGLIITHLPMNIDGDVISVTTWVSGVIASPDGTRPYPTIEEPPAGEICRDSHLDRDDIESRHGDATGRVNAYRTGAHYEPTENHVVVVETFFAHDPLMVTGFLPVPAVIPIYTQTTVRVTLGYADEAR